MPASEWVVGQVLHSGIAPLDPVPMTPLVVPEDDGIGVGEADEVVRHIEGGSRADPQFGRYVANQLALFWVVAVFGRGHIDHLLQILHREVGQHILVIDLPEDATFCVSEVHKGGSLAVLVEQASTLASLGENQFKEGSYLVRSP